MDIAVMSRPPSKRAKPFKGKVRILENSGLRKRMRAARRGMLPPETEGAIADCLTEKALARHPWYRRKKAWDALRALIASSPRETFPLHSRGAR